MWGISYNQNHIILKTFTRFRHRQSTLDLYLYRVSSAQFAPKTYYYIYAPLYADYAYNEMAIATQNCRVGGFFYIHDDNYYIIIIFQSRRGDPIVIVFYI